jgi:periplasmic protein TonB
MHALRFPVAVGLGLFVSLALFTLLWTFIGRTVTYEQVARSHDVTYTRPVIEPPPPPEPTKEILRPPERPVVAIPGILSIDQNEVRTVLSGRPSLHYEPYRGILDIGYAQHAIGQDREVIPLVRILPDYPPGANTEGWVKVQFSITAAGTVRDPFVVDASPKGVFDNAALKAIARWRYSPKIDGGVAVERVGLQTLIHFELQ